MNHPNIPNSALRSPFSRPAPLSALIILARKAADFAAQKRAQYRAWKTEQIKRYAQPCKVQSFTLLSQYIEEVNSGPIYRAGNRERRLNSLVQSKR